MAKKGIDEKTAVLSAEEMERYSRQIMIPSIGVKGQELIKSGRVCIAGAGGLGSVSAYYLAAAGTGRIRIIDCDNVEMSNFNRQILHNTSDLGEPKVLSALEKLGLLNPYCRVEAVQAEIDESNVFEVIGDCQVIVDALDNLHARRILNYASVRMGIPLIYGGVEEFSGMASTFIPGVTPCFECLFSHISDKGGTKGVVGMLPALIGSMQALEALRIILGQTPALAGKLLYVSGSTLSFQNIVVEKNPFCPICSKESARA